MKKQISQDRDRLAAAGERALTKWIRTAGDICSILRLAVFILSLVLVGLVGYSWQSLLFLSAGLLCVPGTLWRMLYEKLHVKEWIILLIALALIVTGVLATPRDRLFSAWNGGEGTDGAPTAALLEQIPAYGGTPYVVVNGDEPFFSEAELTLDSFERYGELDWLGRCTACVACIGRDLMPTAPRESISEVKPTGWKTARYDFVDGEYLYNRCHLIGFQLTAENANPNNLITGTRYLNTEGMLPFENQTAEYVRTTGGHVLYRVTPLFQGSDLVARGVVMEALSVEDGGEAVSFCVFCYNVQPGVEIDYATGDNRLAFAFSDAA